MNILPGIPLSSLLEMFPAAFAPTVLAVTAEGIVLFLQAIAYILVSLAALAVLLRLGLKGGGHGCGCRSSGQGEASAAERGTAGAGSAGSGSTSTGQGQRGTAQGSATAFSSALGGTGANAEAVAGRAGNGSAHGYTNNCCESTSATIGDRARFSTQHSPQCPQHPSQESDRLLAAGGQGAAADSVVASIHAASSQPPAGFAGKGAAPHGEGTADGQHSAEDAAAEQRRITAVIAAAVHNVLGGQPHRIVRIEPVSHGWAQEGRRDIFSSRRVR